MKYLFLIFAFSFQAFFVLGQSPATPPAEVEVEDIEQEVLETEEDMNQPPPVYPSHSGFYSKKEILELNQKETAPRSIASEHWQKSVSGLDFSQDVPPLPREIKKENKRSSSDNFSNWNWNWDATQRFFKIISIIVLLSIGGWLLYQFMQSPPNSVIRAEDGTEITIDNLDAYIQETDLEKFLREALEKGNYNQAVRIYYLQIIKDLSGQKAIEWSREKTNRDYLREMRPHPKFADFRAATRTYEAVWYGNSTLDQSLFERVAAQMKRLL